MEPLEKLEFAQKKIQFVSATKSGEEITLLFTARPEKNSAKIKQTEFIFRFVNGISQSQAINELFSMMSRYVQKMEQLNQ